MESSTATTTTTIPPKSPHSLRDFFTRESRSGSFKTLEKVIDLLNLSSRTVNTANSSQPEERVRRGDFNVSFAEPIHEVVYTATEPLQDHERTLYFYNSKDIADFQKDRALTALMYTKRKEVGIPWEEKNYTLRGLEDLIRKSTSKPGAKGAREEHSAKILAEQRANNNNNNNNTVDPERLREISCQSSRDERLRALNRGKLDASFAVEGNSRRKIIVVKKIFEKISSKKRAKEQSSSSSQA